MPKLINLLGRRFGRLEVMRRSDIPSEKPRWICVCDCGNEVIVPGRNLRDGFTKSCGCYNRDQPKTHGMSGTAVYGRWKSIINRCGGFTEGTRRIYKERGIVVCERWKKFENFYEDMGKSFEEHASIHGEEMTTLDRINGEKGYSPDNCRWATYEVQSRNRKFANKHPGVTKKHGKWKVSIGANGGDIYLGTFEDYAEAVEARKKAEEKYWRE